MLSFYLLNNIFLTFIGILYLQWYILCLIRCSHSFSLSKILHCFEYSIRCRCRPCVDSSHATADISFDMQMRLPKIVIMSFHSAKCFFFLLHFLFHFFHSLVEFTNYINSGKKKEKEIIFVVVFADNKFCRIIFFLRLHAKREIEQRRIKKNSF